MFEDLSNFPYFAHYWAPKGASPLFKQIWIPVIQAHFPLKLVEISLLVRRRKCEKLTDDRRGTKVDQNISLAFSSDLAKTYIQTNISSYYVSYMYFYIKGTIKKT